MPAGEDPLRTHRRALVGGCVLALGIGIVVTAFPVLPGLPGDSRLVMSRQSGAMFVRVDGSLRPVNNRVSADLILGAPVTPRLVGDAALKDISRGPVLGIPGAPHAVGELIAPGDQSWTVCDHADGRTAISVNATDGPSALQTGTAVVASAAHGDHAVYLLYGGRRARIDLDNPATARALHLDGVHPRPVSPTLLALIPEAPVIGPPTITGSSADVAGVRLGGVLRAARAGNDEFYVVVPGGIQRIGRLTADLIRFADPAAGADIPSASPEVIAGTDLVDTLPVAGYPDAAPTLLEQPADVCATWRQGQVGIAAGTAGPEPGTAVPLVIADGDGPNVDVVAVPPGHGAHVTTNATTTGRYLISDAGVVFPVRDSAAAIAIGLQDPPAPIPWAIIAALPCGPELSRQAALAARDVVAPATP